MYMLARLIRLDMSLLKRLNSVVVLKDRLAELMKPYTTEYGVCDYPDEVFPWAYRLGCDDADYSFHPQRLPHLN